MSAGAAQAHPGWDAGAHALWQRGERIAAVQAAVAAVNRQLPAATPLQMQVGYYLFLMHDYAGCATVLQNVLRSQPANVEVRQNVAVCLHRLRRHEEAVVQAQAVLAADPDNLVALDTLTSALHQCGRDDEARVAGTRVLVLKDRHCAAAPAGWALPAGLPQTFAGRAGKRDVIAFSLWGHQPRYLRGAMRNLLLAADLYPGWRCRFYVDATVPAGFTALAQDLGAEVVMRRADAPLREKLAWRFEVANDPGVGRFLVRDIDAVFSAREAMAVQSWVQSPLWFHAMRDWWTHTDLVLAGMWGGVAGVLPALAPMLADYRSPHAETPNIDQWFLRDRVWGMLRASCLVHDRCFTPPLAQPFPGTPQPDHHVGQNEHAAHCDAQARWLRPWIAKYGWLRE
jgi:hypothetical protein